MSEDRSMRPLRVAALVRVSTTHLEQADSPQHQLAYIQGEIGRAGWEESGRTYRAELTGAIIVDRPDIKRMLADAAAGQFDAIVLKSISRLGRDLLGLLMVKRMLDDLHVELIALADGYRSFRDPELIFLVHAERAQAGRQEIAKNVRAGVTQAARRGIWPAGTLPFGLRKESRFAFAPDPETAPIVQLIFALRRQGWGAIRICKHLNSEVRVKAPEWWHLRNRIAALEAGEGAAVDERVHARIRALKRRFLAGKYLWYPRTVRLILANTAYYGELRYNRTTGERRMHGRLVRRNREPEEWLVIPCTPLISRDEWDEAQAVGRSTTPRGRARESAFLLSGLAACGACGGAMRAMRVRPGAGSRGGESKGYYVCRSSVEAGAHPSQYMRASRVEQAVLGALRTVLAEVRAPMIKSKRPPTQPHDAEEVLAVELRDLAEARFYRREELRKGRITEAEFTFELGVIRDREAQVRHRLEQLAAQGTVPQERTTSVEEAVSRLIRLEGTPDAVRLLLGTLVDRVVIHDSESLEIRLTVTEDEVAEHSLYLHTDTTARPTTP